MRWLSSLSGTSRFQRTTSIVASVNRLAWGPRNCHEAVNQKRNDSVNFVDLQRHQRRGGGNRQTEQQQQHAAALTHGPYSQPPPTSLCSSEKKPLLFPKAGREEGLWGEPLLSSTTPPAIKQKERERKRRPDFPILAWRPPYSLPASAHKHRLISSTTTTVVIVFSCNLIGSVCIVALKMSPTMTLLSLCTAPISERGLSAAFLEQK